MSYWMFLAILALSIGYSMEYCQMHIEPDGSTECTMKDGTTIADGKTLKIPEKCESCDCSTVHVGLKTQLSLSCCGYGIHAGAMMPPPGCKIVADDDGCTPKLVKVADETQLC